MTHWLRLPIAVAATGILAAAAPVNIPGKATGEPVSCIKRKDVGRIEGLQSGRVALFHMRGKKVYRNDLPGSCPRIGLDSLVHESSIGLYCRNDVVRFVDLSRGAETGVCVLGAFTPWDLAPADEGAGR